MKLTKAYEKFRKISSFQDFLSLCREFFLLCNREIYRLVTRDMYGKACKSGSYNDPLVQKYHKIAKRRVAQGKEMLGPRSTSEARKYWSTRGSNSPKHSPKQYVEISDGEKEVFKNILRLRDLNYESKIMDVGCNTGRWLNYLYGLGYRNLIGVEINPGALAAMKVYFPELPERIELVEKSGIDALEEMAENSVDCIYTWGTLAVIGPKDNIIFDHMARVSRKYIITFENEINLTGFPRDLNEIFTKLGFESIFTLVTKLCELPTQREFVENWGNLVHYRIFLKTKI